MTPRARMLIALLRRPVDADELPAALRAAYRALVEAWHGERAADKIAAVGFRLPKDARQRTIAEAGLGRLLTAEADVAAGRSDDVRTRLRALTPTERTP